MEELLQKIAKLLGEESLDVNKKFKDYDEWDSFARLYVLSLLDSEYKIQMTYQELEAFASIQDFCNKVFSK